ncbi:hypothetical protein BHE74_00042787 [Ensete ventricosum]|nr:hypothetical protein GW17_00042817 [Ensete ventricosum]RWW50915.1 hypothetical protein BHE74_00042787 [Ensete ventricosum]RZR83601.1 hypothetical protein BHM03_00010250 [Ensete ventricosum]
METIISSLVASSGLCSDWVGRPKESLVSNMKENLHSSRVEWDIGQFRTFVDFFLGLGVIPSDLGSSLSAALSRRSGFPTYPWLEEGVVPHPLVALLGLALIGGLPIVEVAKGRTMVGASTEGRSAIGIPIFVLTEGYVG